MNNLIKSFIENQNIGSIIAEVSAVVGSVVAWYYNYRKTISPIYSASIGQDAIYQIMEKLESNIKSTNISSTICELTNGGGIPKVDRPLYIKALFATDKNILELYGDKTLLSRNLLHTISTTFMEGQSKIKINDLHNKVAEQWAEVVSMDTLFFFLIGIDGKTRSLVYVVNSPSNNDFDGQEYINIIKAKNDIKKIINNSRKFYQSKIE